MQKKGWHEVLHCVVVKLNKNVKFELSDANTPLILHLNWHISFNQHSAIATSRENSDF